MKLHWQLELSLLFWGRRNLWDCYYCAKINCFAQLRASMLHL